jgi:hypothetical protein
MGVWARCYGDGSGEPAEAETEVRWGRSEDELQIARLLELNGVPRWLAFEERYIVAEERGEVVAALGYRTAHRELFLGLLVVDPLGGERCLAEALYAGALELAREAGISEVCTRALYSNYPDEIKYHWRGGWYADMDIPFEDWSELPASGWRRVLALMEVVAIPFYRAFRS